MHPPSGIRWGLCCQFLDAPIRFRQATHRYVATVDDLVKHKETELLEV